MKAMIFAAGLGSRLKPLTDNTPKALVPINGKPMLQYLINRLKNAGVNEIIINLHHFADQIIEFVESNKSFDISIEFSDERERLLDTGGALKKASHFFDDGEPFIVHNVDIFSNIDLQRSYNYFKQSKSIANMVVSSRETSRHLLFDNNNMLRGWVNKKTGDLKSPIINIDSNISQYREYAFSGIHFISPAIFKLMEAMPEKFSIIDFYISICEKVDIEGYLQTNFKMRDAGTHKSLQKLSEEIGSSDGRLLYNIDKLPTGSS